MNEPTEFKSVIGGNSLLVEPWPEARPNAMLRLAIANDRLQLITIFSEEQAASIRDELDKYLGRK